MALIESSVGSSNALPQASQLQRRQKCKSLAEELTLKFKAAALAPGDLGPQGGVFTELVRRRLTEQVLATEGQECRQPTFERPAGVIAEERAKWYAIGQRFHWAQSNWGQLQPSCSTGTIPELHLPETYGHAWRGRSARHVSEHSAPTQHTPDASCSFKEHYQESNDGACGGLYEDAGSTPLLNVLVAEVAEQLSSGVIPAAYDDDGDCEEASWACDQQLLPSADYSLGMQQGAAEEGGTQFQGVRAASPPRRAGRAVHFAEPHEQQQSWSSTLLPTAPMGGASPRQPSTRFRAWRPAAVHIPPSSAGPHSTSSPGLSTPMCSPEHPAECFLTPASHMSDDEGSVMHSPGSPMSPVGALQLPSFISWRSSEPQPSHLRPRTLFTSTDTASSPQKPPTAPTQAQPSSSLQRPRVLAPTSTQPSLSLSPQQARTGAPTQARQQSPFEAQAVQCQVVEVMSVGGGGTCGSRPRTAAEIHPASDECSATQHSLPGHPRVCRVTGPGLQLAQQLSEAGAEAFYSPRDSW